MKKRLVSILAAAAVFVTAACGNTSAQTVETAARETETAVQTAETAAQTSRKKRSPAAPVITKDRAAPADRETGGVAEDARTSRQTLNCRK